MSKIKEIKNEVVLFGRKNNQSWFAPCMAVVPWDGEAAPPEVHIGVQQLTGNDLGPGHWIRTADLGKTWSPPMESQNLLGDPREDDIFEKGGFGLYWHSATQTLFALGATCFLRDCGEISGQKMEEHVSGFSNSMAYAVWNRQRGDFEPWVRMDVPKMAANHENVRSGGCSQWHECEDGTLLMPAYIGADINSDEKYSSVVVLRFRFDGQHLEYVEHGSVHMVKEGRGLHEPSLAFFQGRYFMTIRSDQRGYVTTSKDGLHFDKIRPWTFDDGRDLGNYNTQQHWLQHKDSLFLVYNRKSELNNGVFRSRAPLFIAEVDSKTLQVVRDTEHVVFPEKGARMGNFAVANVTEKEAWIVTGEWLEQMVPGYKKGMRFWADSAPKMNRIQYIGDLLLARVIF